MPGKICVVVIVGGRGVTLGSGVWVSGNGVIVSNTLVNVGVNSIAVGVLLCPTVGSLVDLISCGKSIQLEDTKIIVTNQKTAL